ncbi:MAG TPA: dihydrofolate reductase family protein [Anaerolineales bacterium]|nr:dihydrofolate reductase family protein [Anaerolineales bacterium]
MYPFETWLSRAQEHLEKTGRPLVSLSYAQSLDGSLSDQPGKVFGISGPQSLALTHQLRSLHEAILVGVGTVLVDDPRLTARLSIEKEQSASRTHIQPRPIVVDSGLRTPPTARLIQAAEKTPWIAAVAPLPADRREALHTAGAEILLLPADEHGNVSLPDLLACLGQRGISSLMVEGGARILQSFLQQHLADQVIVTIAPIYLGGIPIIEPWQRSIQTPLRLAEVGCQLFGEDIVLWGQLNPWHQTIDEGNLG